jgi:hypothetical protein
MANRFPSCERIFPGSARVLAIANFFQQDNSSPNLAKQKFVSARRRKSEPDWR